MNKSYVIVPCALLGAFIVFERTHQRDRAAAESVRAIQVAAAKASAEQNLAELRERTAAESRQRAAQREHEERDRVEKKRREAEDALRTVEAEAEMHAAAATRLAREAEALEQQVAEQRAARQRAQDRAFALARQVEEGRIDRRNVDLELQRTTRMLAARLLESAWTTPPAAAGR